MPCKGIVLVCVLTGAMLPAAAGAEPALPSLDEIVAAVESNASRVRSLRAEYTFTRRWLYESVYSGPLTRFGPPPERLALEPKDEERAKLGLRTEVKWVDDGPRFAYESRAVDEAKKRLTRSWHAFDGEMHRHLNEGSEDVTASIKLAGDPYSAPGLDMMTPRRMADEFELQPIAYWLAQDASLSLEPEDVDGRECLVVECTAGPRRRRAKLWLCPELGYRALRMESYRDGEIYRLRRLTDFVQVEDGLWLPLATTQETHLTDPKTGARVIFSVAEYRVEPGSVVVNGEVDDAEFELEFPGGARVTNNILGILYTEGKDDAVQVRKANAEDVRLMLEARAAADAAQQAEEIPQLPDD